MGYEARRYVYSVTPYVDEWKKIYEREAARIKGTLGNELLYLEHVGGTAVAGGSGKPVVDILAVVRDIGKIDSYDAAFRAIGYEAAGDDIIINGRLFGKDIVHPHGGWERLVDLYVLPDEHPKMMDMINTRDYLKAHPEELKKLEEFKTRLFKKHPHDHAAYEEEKQSFLREFARKAARWRGRHVDEDWGTV